MTKITTKPDSSQPASKKAVDLFDNGYDPIETEVRARAREFIEELIRSELDDALARPRYQRSNKVADNASAAVMMRWATLPAKIQRELFEYATSLAGLTQEAHLRGRIGRFLHNHKDGDDRTIDNDGA